MHSSAASELRTTNQKMAARSMAQAVRMRGLGAFTNSVQKGGASLHAIGASAARFFHPSPSSRQGKLFVSGWSQSG